MSGLYFYNARYYDSGLGRFISADTVVPGIGNPQAWNRYSYVLNNPLRYTDPSGHYSAEDTLLYNSLHSEEYGMCGCWTADDLRFLNWYRAQKDLEASGESEAL
ncbi:MAG: RHS repeat-associated core domain-containing protein, partial [Chloroflexi bacterium]|nr:RHS repeat-associated core domain-containing protein [Chloroflexota bacterium]